MTNAKIIVLLRIWIGLWLLIPGFLKVITLSDFADIVIENWTPVIPDILVPLMQYVLPFMEVIIGFMVTVGIYASFSTLVYSGMHVLFTGICMYALIGGIPINDCGCFGAFIKNPNTIGGLIKDITFLYLAFVVILSFKKFKQESEKVLA